MLRRPLLLATLVLLVLAGPLWAQATGTSTTKKSKPGVIVSPYGPPPTGGGQGYVPPDAGTPDTIGPGDGGGGADPTISPGGAGLAGAARGGSVRGGTAVAGTRASSSGATTTLSIDAPDTWQTWWETNKFDFIELRRVYDAPFTGQGRQRETAEQREQRLAGVRQVLHDQVAPVLRQLTKAEDPAVRASAIVALAKLRDPSGIPLARDMLRDRSFDVRRSAMLALGVQQGGQPSYLLMNIADDNSLGRRLLDTSRVTDEDRGIAMLSATLRGGGAAGLLLDRLLEESDQLPPEVLAAACEASGLRAEPSAIRPLARIAADEQLPEFVRSAATTALGRVGLPTVGPILLDLLDSGLEPKRAATVALGFVGRPGLPVVMERLITLMQSDSDAPTRHFAAISLGRIGGEQARLALGQALEDGRSDMRPWVAIGLSLVERQAPQGRLPSLLIQQAADEGNAETAGAYLIALGLCGSPDGLDLLERELARGRVSVASQAAMALGLSGQPDALTILTEALQRANSPALQSQIALGLGVLGNSAAAPDLLELIRTTNNPFVASYSALGIAFMGDENAIGPLLRIIEQGGTRGVATTYAVLAVGQLFDSDRRPALSRLAAGDNYLARSAAVSDLLALGF